MSTQTFHCSYSDPAASAASTKIDDSKDYGPSKLDRTLNLSFKKLTICMQHCTIWFNQFAQLCRQSHVQDSWYVNVLLSSLILKKQSNGYSISLAALGWHFLSDYCHGPCIFMIQSCLSLLPAKPPGGLSGPLKQLPRGMIETVVQLLHSLHTPLPARQRLKGRRVSSSWSTFWDQMYTDTNQHVHMPSRSPAAVAFSSSSMCSSSAAAARSACPVECRGCQATSFHFLFLFCEGQAQSAT